MKKETEGGTVVSVPPSLLYCIIRHAYPIILKLPL